MHSYTPNQRRRRAGRAIGAAALLAFSCLVLPGGSPLHAEEGDSLAPTPVETPSQGNTQNRGQTPEYWAGSYWDNRDGNGFWHNLKPESSTKPASRERKRPAFGFGASVKDPAAGSADKRR